VAAVAAAAVAVIHKTPMLAVEEEGEAAPADVAEGGCSYTQQTISRSPALSWPVVFGTVGMV
jgi:hypothetical protein